MEDNQEFEAITLSNIWIKEHILDIIRSINQNEILAEAGGIDLISINEMESVDIIRTRIDALKLMRAYILQLRDNVSQYLSREKLIEIEINLIGIEDHEDLIQKNENQISHEETYFLSSHFKIKLDRLRKVKSILINCCGEAGLLMPKKDDQTKNKLVMLD